MVIRPNPQILSAIPAIPSFLSGTPLWHMAGVRKLPTINPGPTTTIVTSRVLHGAILPGVL
jgi:hypothetical protein